MHAKNDEMQQPVMKRGIKYLYLYTAGSLKFSCRSDPHREKITRQIYVDNQLFPVQDQSNWPDRFCYGRRPSGSGTVTAARTIYGVKCADYHGAKGVAGTFPRLVSTDTSKAKTIGNYWPYARTVFDFIRSAMPYKLLGW
jgi:hypothetical protein